ncbi:ABC transporter substrate-binding protein [Methanothermobacter tenebrarum]|uniref:Aliphatic sulfonates ABC transporter substrate-binding protein n=1 Tax=Methanothermobacter tenebrarum TaxID=680118 RepID=A0A328PEC7_9EURY|nr:ABC transporter substrate-binding protein [Methanothermobacter tenebrarum]MBC7101245.1 ABC transporter substrate-binding protein [Methanobacteriales archaeon]MBC7117530.1 ABC transporter substrate-binding protein [Methanobacteriaceae archaeon]NPV64487.1 ABC transporter substrate-binding protein [Methanobacteriaceae archaeon]RAO78722.1 aliphatic sulfonates ABC transporter substrate-binding protein [Methanothermobacter tenebrarum]
MDKKWIIAAIIIVVVVITAAYTLQPKTEEVIRVGHLKDDHHSALFIAQAKEMYEKEGLKVETIEFNAGPDLVKAAATGQIDIGFCGTPPAVTGIAKGVPIKIVAAVNQEGSGIIVREDAGIQKIEDLKGKTIAIPMKGSIQDVLLQMTLKEHGINPEEVNIIEMQVPLMPKALEAGKIDGFIAWEPYVSMAEQKGYGHAIAYSRDIWKDHPCCVVIATDQFIKEHPDQLRRFLKVHVEATEYLNTHKNESASIVAEALGTDPAVEKRAFQNMKFIAVPTSSFIDNVMKFVGIEKQLGYIKKDLKKDDIFDLKYLP